MQIFEPYKLTGLKPNHLSFGGLDRGAELHEDKDCIQNLLGAEETLLVPVWRKLNLFSKTGEKGEKPLPAFLTVDEASSLIQFQQAFSANARIIQTARELFDSLMRVVSR